ncbi:hypothetical protein LTR37_008248 [Vermiconidia calcicola]|uniref:Uncharacterized protein n=1 Tax=Vermiconidia calcicola TaxID=1690605 RepID=A0ACC3NC83_9PEZI|nr:hypothetical protein LTR37_008248 [Vermiconidia calcicola]
MAMTGAGDLHVTSSTDEPHIALSYHLDMVETRPIVFLGASYAGLSASHYFLKHVYPHLPNEPEVQYKAILVDPSTKWFTRHAAPRAIIKEELMPTNLIFHDIEAGYKQYGDKVEFLQGRATAWDESARTMSIQKANGESQTIAYWALILATGTKATSPLFSLQGTPHTEVESAIRGMRGRLASAKDIVIAGGGPAAVESAGEIGDFLNGAAGWFSSRPFHPKAKITLITSSSKLLPQLRQSLSDQAEKFLNRVGVDVRYNTKVYSNVALGDGKTKVILHDGEELETDIYIPAMGVKPMSGYVPDHLKNDKGYVVQNDSTLRIDAAGPRVYAIGDIGTYSNDGIMEIINGVPVMETNLKRDLLAAHSDPNGEPEGEDRLYVREEREMQIVPVGRSRGVGAVFGWRVPSILVWLIKGRDFMTSKAHEYVSGEAVKKEA